MSQRTVAAGAFKQGCLALLDEVAEGNLEIVVTKRGRPVAKLVPLPNPREQEAQILSRMRARVRGSIGKAQDLQFDKLFQKL